MKVAILIPCYNEALTIEKVVADFRRELPDADVFVYDNNSSDGSAELAARAGAVVRHVAQQGKGFVVRRMFQEVEAGRLRARRRRRHLSGRGSCRASRRSSARASS